MISNAVILANPYLKVKMVMKIVYNKCEIELFLCPPVLSVLSSWFTLLFFNKSLLNCSYDRVWLRIDTPPCVIKILVCNLICFYIMTCLLQITSMLSTIMLLIQKMCSCSNQSINYHLLIIQVTLFTIPKLQR